MKETIVSGIRATGRLHIGNYLGALNEFVKLQTENKGQNYFFIADLHALTTPFEPRDLTDNTYQVVAEYLAAGIDPEKTVFFLQNHVLEHAELAWIFNCITPLGELERMTQFKDKSRQHKANINAGLLTYPTLMAADILAYKPSAVPVGEDQVQHVELARVVARKFNARFGQVFPEPKTYLQKPLRIMSLKDPEKKMSKTGDEALMLDDSPADVTRKLKKAVTATEGQAESAGSDNLFLMLEHFGTAEQQKHFAAARKDGTLKFSELKETLAQAIAGHFAEFRERKESFLKSRKQLDEVLASGADKARAAAQATLREVKEKVGFGLNSTEGIMYVYAVFRATPGRPAGYQEMSCCPLRWLSALQGKHIEGYDPSEFRDRVLAAGPSEKSTLSLDLEIRDPADASEKDDYLAFLRRCLGCERIAEFPAGERRHTPWAWTAPPPPQENSGELASNAA